MADPKKALEQLSGWKVTLTLDDMCQHLWQFYQKNPTGYDS